MRTPESSRPRTDLPWLRHRRAAPAPAPVPTPTPARSTPSLSLDPPAAPPSRPATTATSPGLSVDPPAPAAAPTPAPSPTPGLSLDRPPPTPPRPTPPAGSSLLDLSPPEGAAPRGRSAPRRVRPRTLPYPRVARGATVALTPTAPTVTLTRLQSGIGHLRISFARGASTGDLTIGMVVQQDDGSTHVVQALGDATSTPATPLPLVRLEPQGDLLVDLHLVPRLRRAMVYAFSPTGAAVNWDGLLTLRTQDGSRVDAALSQRVRRGTCALLTLYNVHGELVLRSEMVALDGPPEQAAEAYGFRYAWLDGRFPSS